MLFQDYMITKKSAPRDLEYERRMKEYFRGKIMGLGFHTSEVEPVEFEKILDFCSQYQIALLEKGPFPEKGLFICGNVGRGKTMIVAIISWLLKISMFPMQEIDEVWAKNPIKVRDEFPEIYQTFENRAVIIDDIGAESGLKHYGSESACRPLMMKLYDLWRWQGKLVIVTSNLSMSERMNDSARTVTGVLGERVYSRFREMFEVVRFTGATDYRKISR